MGLTIRMVCGRIILEFKDYPFRLKRIIFTLIRPKISFISKTIKPSFLPALIFNFATPLEIILAYLDRKWNNIVKLALLTWEC